MYLEWARVRYPVADDLVDRGAAAVREVVVVEWAWIAFTLDAGLVHHAVDLVGRHSHATRPGGTDSHFISRSCTSNPVWGFR